VTLEAEEAEAECCERQGDKETDREKSRCNGNIPDLSVRTI
jgi:hypothetical protein